MRPQAQPARRCAYRVAVSCSLRSRRRQHSARADTRRARCDTRPARVASRVRAQRAVPRSAGSRPPRAAVMHVTNTACRSAVLFVLVVALFLRAALAAAFVAAALAAAAVVAVRRFAVALPAFRLRSLATRCPCLLLTLRCARFFLPLQVTMLNLRCGMCLSRWLRRMRRLHVFFRLHIHLRGLGLSGRGRDTMFLIDRRASLVSGLGVGLLHRLLGGFRDAWRGGRFSVNLPLRLGIRRLCGRACRRTLSLETLARDRLVRLIAVILCLNRALLLRCARIAIAGVLALINGNGASAGTDFLSQLSHP